MTGTSTRTLAGDAAAFADSCKTLGRTSYIRHYLELQNVYCL